MIHCGTWQLLMRTKLCKITLEATVRCSLEAICVPLLMSCCQGSSFHVVEYNETTGEVIRQGTAQGYADNRSVSSFGIGSPGILSISKSAHGLADRDGESSDLRKVRLETCESRDPDSSRYTQSVPEYRESVVSGHVSSNGDIFRCEPTQ